MSDGDELQEWGGHLDEKVTKVDLFKNQGQLTLISSRYKYGPASVSPVFSVGWRVGEWRERRPLHGRRRPKAALRMLGKKRRRRPFQTPPHGLVKGVSPSIGAPLLLDDSKQTPRKVD